MNIILLKLIQLIHIIFIAFIVITPFMNNELLLMLHIIVIPFMIFHWKLNNDTCALTIIEHYIRLQINCNSNVNDCFTYRIVGPVYNFVGNNNDFSFWIYVISIVLWLVSVGKVYKNYKYNKNSIINIILDKYYNKSKIQLQN